MRGENVPAQYEVILQRKDGSFFQGEVRHEGRECKRQARGTSVGEGYFQEKAN